MAISIFFEVKFKMPHFLFSFFLNLKSNFVLNQTFSKNFFLGVFNFLSA